jgi:membrane protease subunit HflC
VQLETIERQMLERVRPAALSQYGVEVVALGLKRMGPTEAVSTTILDAMRKQRELDAQKYKSLGQSRAAQITAEADRIAREVLSFAQYKANQIRSQGEAEAAGWYAGYGADQGFAQFLSQMQVYKAMLSQKTQFIIDSESFGGAMRWLLHPPTAEEVRRGLPIGSQAATAPARQAPAEPQASREGTDHGTPN